MVSTGKKTALTIRIIWAILGLFIIIMIVSQLYIYFYNPIKTEPATMYSTTSSVLFKGIFIRDEKYVRYDGTGVVSYTNSNGSKLAKNSVIAQIYTSRQDLAIERKIEEKKQQIKVLQDAQSLVGADNSQLEAFANQISDRHMLLVSAVQNNDYEKLSSLKNDYLNLQCKKQIVKGTEVSYSQKISALNMEISALRDSLSGSTQDLRVDDTGYFVSNVDGYENTLNVDSIKNLTKEQIDEIIRNPVLEVDNNVIGKIVDGYKWNFVGVIEAEKIPSVFEGSKYKLRVGSSSKTIDAVVQTVKRLDDGNNLLVFSCDSFYAELVEARVSQFRLLMDDFTGIRVPVKAIRFDENNKAGVFVKTGVQVNFKYIDTIVSSDDYLLVRDTTDEPDYISLYDSVIVEGKDLYDGKIVL